MPSRSELEEIWGERVRAARLTYHFATLHFNKVLADQKAWPLPAPDGSAAIHNARREESAARDEFMRSLKILTDLLLNGKEPEERQDEPNA